MSGRTTMNDYGCDACGRRIARTASGRTYPHRCREVPERTRADVLVGRWFHSFEDAADGCRVVRWQGRVLGSPRPETYLVQLHEWVMGEASDEVLVSLDQIVSEGWVFYTDAEAMAFAYEHGNGAAGRSRYHHERHGRQA